MKTTGLYGNDLETYGVDEHGRVWTLQSQDTWPTGAAAYQLEAWPEDEVQPVEHDELHALLEALGRTNPQDREPGFVYHADLAIASDVAYLQELGATVTSYDGDSAETTITYRGRAVGCASWQYERWNDAWNYSGHSRDCWADGYLCEFLDEHERGAGSPEPVDPGDVLAVAERAIRRYERENGYQS